jgi:GTP-binding protein EngB required for normal cell division
MPDITLSLISHTNVGKTTLMRTLLRRDIGEVSDHAHVTGENERHILCETAAGNRLYLWDTPGFGDTAQLLRRLKEHDKPIKWLLLQTWDRLANKPLYCNQQAVLSAQQDADVVLYLVNAAESPEDAGYVDMEMEVLEWIGRPVIVLLNQVGQAKSHEQLQAECDRWRKHLAKFSILREVLALDAFTRCWVQEGTMLEHVRSALPDDQHTTFNALFDVWLADHHEVFSKSISAVATHLHAVATLREPVEKASRGNVTRAVKKLTQHIQRSQRAMGDELLAMHQLDGHAAAEIRTDLDDYLRPKKKRNEWLSGAIAGAGSGLIGGIAADFLAGGLTFGGGAAAGFLLGFAAGSSLQGLFNLIGQGSDKAVAPTPDFLDQLLSQAVVFYLAVAHYGRGRGAWREAATLDTWTEAVHTALEPQRAQFHTAWKQLAAEPTSDPSTLNREVAALLRASLVSQYPEAGDILPNV